jgi:hypothetical protein
LLEKLRSVHTVTKCISGHQIWNNEMGENFRTNGINDMVCAYADRQKERKACAFEIIMPCVCVCVCAALKDADRHSQNLVFTSCHCKSPHCFIQSVIFNMIVARTFEVGG